MEKMVDDVARALCAKLADMGPTEPKNGETWEVWLNHHERFKQLADAAIKVMHDSIAAKDREIARLREALERQCDNMAFAINHADLGSMHDKFQAELETDRAALAQDGSQPREDTAQ